MYGLCSSFNSDSEQCVWTTQYIPYKDASVNMHKDYKIHL